jgi:hypothetical protein
MDQTFNVVNMFATRPLDEPAAASIGDLGAVGVPITESTWPFGGLQEHLRAAGAQCPRVLPRNGWRLDAGGVAIGEDAANRPRDPYGVAEWRLWLVAIPYTGFVVVLSATARGDGAAAVRLLNDSFFRRARIRVGAAPLAHAVRALWAAETGGNEAADGRPARP